jgi:hypothetical protein
LSNLRNKTFVEDIYGQLQSHSQGISITTGKTSQFIQHIQKGKA